MPPFRSCLALLAALLLQLGVGCANDKVCAEGDTTSPLCDPDRINTRGWEDSPFMSRDGQRLFFMYSTHNFMPIFRLGLPERRGPQREGFVARDNPFDEARVYVATRLTDDAGWSPPTLVPVEVDGTACCLMTNDERRFWFQAGGEGGPDLVSVDVDDAGVAAAPVFHTSASSSGLEDNPHASLDERVVWFTSEREGGQGGKDLWVAVRGDDGLLGTAQNVTSLNTGDNEDQIWVRSDNLVAVFNRGGRMFRSERSSAEDPAADTWGPAEELLFEGASLEAAEASLTDDEAVLVFALVDRELDDIVIVESRRTGPGAYTTPVPVD